MTTFPDPALDTTPTSGQHTAVFAGGCFWCTEAVFELVEGVEDVMSGYAGDTEELARYDIVCSGTTRHAEAILITYDAAKVTFGGLLKVFFSVAHDPTTRDRQGHDVGPQYRSAIFYTSEEQKQTAEAYIRQIDQANVLHAPIVTELSALDKFYSAEAYHQNYAVNNRHNRYIVGVADPKVEKLKKMFPGCRVRFNA